MLTPCPECKRERDHYAKGVCKRCYGVLYANPLYRERHQAQIRQYGKGYYQRNKERHNASSRATRRRLRIEAIEAYGGRCRCCGESQPAFLTIDHINGGGRKHQLSLGGPSMMLRQLRREGWPTDLYQLLCMNCNMAKWTEGECPHTSKSPKFQRA